MPLKGTWCLLDGKKSMELYLTGGPDLALFLEKHATVYGQAQWLVTIKTDDAYEASSAGPSSASSQTASYQPEWTWSEQYAECYYIDKKGKYIWES